MYIRLRWHFIRTAFYVSFFYTYGLLAQLIKCARCLSFYGGVHMQHEDLSRDLESWNRPAFAFGSFTFDSVSSGPQLFYSGHDSC